MKRLPFLLALGIAACAPLPAEVLVDAGGSNLDAGGGSDGGLDAGRADGGVVDAGAPDAAVLLDAGAPDAGLDAGAPGRDAGPDAGAQPDAGSAADGGADAGGQSDAAVAADAGRVVRFIAVGDTGKSNPEQRQVGATMAQVCAAQGCDFVTLLGDNFYSSGVATTGDALWSTAFLVPYAALLDAGVPFYPVLGNHDYGGDGAGYEIARAQVQVAYSAVNPLWRMPAPHYKFTVGAVDVFVADTNRSMWGFDQNAMADFNGWLPASTATWKLALGHHPYLSNGPHGNAGRYDGLSGVPVASGDGVKRFLDQRVCGKADVYFSGHDHSLQWLVPGCQGTELIVSGAGASTTSLTPRNQTHYQSDQLGFLYVVIDGRRLTGTFYDAQGMARFTRTLTK